MEAENIVDKKELKGLPIWACILLFIVVFFVFMLLYSALIQGFLSLVLGVEARHPGIVGYILQETGMFLAALTSAVDRKSTRLNSSHSGQSRMPSSA